jgi:serine protease inhibitor
MKTRLDKAMNNEFSEDSSIENINKSMEIAKNMKILDIIDADSKTRNELAEIVNRLQNANKLEIFDLEEYTGNMYPCS